MQFIDTRAGLPSARRTETFTGTVWGDPVSDPGTDPTASTVVFAPHGRTYWHRHQGGQLVTASAGEGLVVADDGTSYLVGEGQSVWTPSGETHWHGAGPQSILSHTAYSFGITDWLDEVSDEEYEAGVEAAHRGTYRKGEHA
jgi:quercetin dioxygenase-like cupin family protein